MPRLLPLRGDHDRRMICSECRKRYGDDMKRDWPFGAYDSPAESEMSAISFEIRGTGDSVEWRELAPGTQQWKPLTSRQVICSDCLHASSGRDVLLYDPRTGQQQEP
jgi:hypothetical protein